MIESGRGVRCEWCYKKEATSIVMGEDGERGLDVCRGCFEVLMGMRGAKRQMTTTEKRRRKAEQKKGIA